MRCGRDNIPYVTKVAAATTTTEAAAANCTAQQSDDVKQVESSDSGKTTIDGCRLSV